MKLVLASAGIETKGVTEKIIELARKPASEISVAFIVEAGNMKDRDKRWQINELYKTSNIFGGIVRIVNLLALDIDEIEARLTKSDVVFCLGGNTCYLKTVFDKSGLSGLLPQILKKVIWLGNSAGSMILGKRCPYRESLKTSNEATYGVEKFLKLIDCHIIPHINADKKPEHLLETCIEESKQHSSPIYALSDDSALVINGNNSYMIGTNCWKIENGKITEQK